MSKYQPLASYLASRPEGTVRLTFKQVETILNIQALPNTARANPRWWANSNTNDSHSWAHCWQRAGWEHAELNLTEGWVVFRRTDPGVRYFRPGSNLVEALEGHKVERTVLSSVRCRPLAEARRERDGFTCQSCGFHLEHEGGYVAEVHHLDPVSRGERVTTIDDLVTLCPTCHAVAHLRSPPYVPDQIHRIVARGAPEEPDGPTAPRMNPAR